MGILHRISLGLCLCAAVVPCLAQLQDKVHAKDIHSVYIHTPSRTDLLQGQALMEFSPLIPLENQGDYQLSFDDLSAKPRSYTLSILACDADWKVENISELEYLQDFNDQALRQFRPSEGTKVPYYHYSQTLPKIKLGGNYIAMVYRNRNKRDTVFTKRFSIGENLMNVAVKVQYPNQNAYRNTHQSLNLTIKYPPSLLIEEVEQLKIYVRTVNRPWGKAMNWRSSMQHQANEGLIRFQFFEGTNFFPGGNEYLTMDLRSSQVKLNGVERIQTTDTLNALITQAFALDSKHAYLQRRDLNGALSIQNYEYPDRPQRSDYVGLLFRIKSPELPTKLYVMGAFNGYAAKEAMRYDASMGEYQWTTFLKQGIYDLGLFLDNGDRWDGNFSQTENRYEVAIYYRLPGQRHESLIAFAKVNFP